MNIDNILKHSKRTLICGKDSSGKTEFLKRLVKNLSSTEEILVLSNHKEIKQEALKPENVQYLHKMKSCKHVDLIYLNTEATYIFIDEICENIKEISEYLKEKHLIFVKTILEEINEEDKSLYDVIIQVRKDSYGIVAIDKIIEK